MYYDYSLIVVKRELNKKKIALIIIISVIVLALSIFGIVKLAQYNEEKKLQHEAELQKQQILEEEQRIAEEKRIAAEKEAELQKRKNTFFFTEEQLQSIENIYDVEEKRVFLTFDDGPTETVTPLILDYLKQENIEATFFVLGNRAKANPELIKRELEEGHYIANRGYSHEYSHLYQTELNEGHYVANHGYSHKYSQIYANPQNVLEEYEYAETCIQEALEIPDYHSKVFRFPGGSMGGYYSNVKNQAKDLLRENGIAYLDWNALSRDAEGVHTSEALLENVMITVEDKQSVVLLMHDASDKILTYETLPQVVQFFRDNGYEFKNIYDII